MGSQVQLPTGGNQVWDLNIGGNLLYYTVLYFAMVYFIIMYVINSYEMYCHVMFCYVMYCYTVQYCNVLLHTVQYCNVLLHSTVLYIDIIYLNYSQCVCFVHLNVITVQ